MHPRYEVVLVGESTAGVVIASGAGPGVGVRAVQGGPGGGGENRAGEKRVPEPRDRTDPLGWKIDVDRADGRSGARGQHASGVGRLGARDGPLAVADPLSAAARLVSFALTRPDLPNLAHLEGRPHDQLDR